MHMHIYRKIKMSSTRLGKIDSVWHTTPNYQACNEAEKNEKK